MRIRQTKVFSMLDIRYMLCTMLCIVMSACTTVQKVNPTLKMHLATETQTQSDPQRIISFENKQYFILPDASFNYQDVAEITQASNMDGVLFVLKPSQHELLRNLSINNLDNYFAVLLGSDVLSVAKIQTQFNDGRFVLNKGHMLKSDIDDMLEKLTD